MLGSFLRRSTSEGGTERRVVHFAGFKGGRPCPRIGNDTEADAVEIRQALLPIIRIAFDEDILAAHPFLEDERPGADELAVPWVAQRLRAFIEVTRHNAGLCGGQYRPDRRRRLGQAEDRRMCIGGVDRYHRFVSRACPRVDLLDHLQDRVLHVRGSERLAIMPFHTLPEMEGDGQAVGCHLPAFGKRGHGLEVLIVFDQPFNDLRVENPRRHRIEQEARRFGFEIDDQCPAPSRRLFRRALRAQPRKKGCE